MIQLKNRSESRLSSVTFMIKDELKPLYKRILQISYDKKLSHVGSCITALPIIDEIYSVKKYQERFVLSSGHAGLALYVILEKYMQLANHTPYKTAEKIFEHHGVHPDRCYDCGIDCSTGSLGQGLPIAVGMALADRSKNVYCLLSDGEMAEGSVFEALRIRAEQNLWNLKVYINDNGWAAYRETNIFNGYAQFLDWSHIEYRETDMNDYPEWLRGQIAHYKVLDKKEYTELMEVLK